MPGDPRDPRGRIRPDKNRCNQNILLLLPIVASFPLVDLFLPRRGLPGLAHVDYEELAGGGRPASASTASAMTIADLSPRLALQRLLMLYENGDHRYHSIPSYTTKLQDNQVFCSVVVRNAALGSSYSR